MYTDNLRLFAQAAAETAPETEEAAMSFGERIAYGGQVTIIGIAIIFAVLATLWGVLTLFKVFFYDMPEKKKANAKAKDIAPAPATVEEVAATPVPESTDDTQLIAVITAAIAAYNSQSGASLPFRVVSYKRVRGANGWNGADENETI